MKLVQIKFMTPGGLGNLWWELFWDFSKQISYLSIPIASRIHYRMMNNFTRTVNLRNELIRAERLVDIKLWVF